MLGLAAVRTSIRRYVVGGRRFLFTWRGPVHDAVDEVSAISPGERTPTAVDEDPAGLARMMRKLEEDLATHTHDDVEHRLMELAEADQAARSELLAALDEMDRASASAGRYLGAGLGLALVGAVLQVIALVS